MRDDRSESSARRRGNTPITLTEGCGVTTGSTGSVGIARSTGAVEVRGGVPVGTQRRRRACRHSKRIINESWPGGT